MTDGYRWRVGASADLLLTGESEDVEGREEATVERMADVIINALGWVNKVSQVGWRAILLSVTGPDESVPEKAYLITATSYMYLLRLCQPPRPKSNMVTTSH